MTLFKNKGIKFKVVFSISTLFIIILSLLLIFNISKNRAGLQQEMNRGSSLVATVIMKSIEPAMAQGDMEAVENSFKNIKTELNNIDFFLINPEQKITYSTNQELIGKTIPDVIQNPDLKNAITNSIKDGTEFDTGFREEIASKPFYSAIQPVLNEEKCFECHDENEKVLGLFFSRLPLEATQNQIRKTTSFSTIISIVGLLIMGAILFLIISLLVVKPVEEVSTLLREIAEGEGNLTSRLSSSSKDEIGELTGYFNKFIQNIQNLVLLVKSNTKQVNQSTGEISLSSGEMSEIMTNQRDQVQLINNAMEELMITSNDIAESIDHTTKDISHSNELTKEGGAVIQESNNSLKSIKTQTDTLNQTITRLSHSAGKIGNIISVINDVADQTNLLALNAAIEAARAGEAGRGFAIVADEVRKLAERTANATSEISNIINTLQAETKSAEKAMKDTGLEVQKGNEFGLQSLEILQKIIVSSEKVMESTSRIAAAVTEENATINEVKENAHAIEDATKTSSEALKKVSNSSDDLKNHTDSLAVLLNRFKTE